MVQQNNSSTILIHWKFKHANQNDSIKPSQCQNNPHPLHPSAYFQSVFTKVKPMSQLIKRYVTDIFKERCLATLTETIKHMEKIQIYSC